MTANDCHLFIATPAYGGMVHTDFVAAVLGYQAAGLRFALMTIGNESLITRARNSLLAEFAVRPEYTHLLFLDADVMLAAADLTRMLAAERDVIGAPVALKGRAADGSRLFNVGATRGEEGALIEVTRIGTAALLLSRAAVLALVADATEAGRVYSAGMAHRGIDRRAAVHYDVFQVGVLDDEYLSEDFWVCRRLRALGYPIYVDPTIVTRHSGVLPA